MTDLNRGKLMEKLDKWLITAMSHMRTIYEDNDIPWSEENEKSFQAIRKLIQRKVGKEEFKIEAEKLFERSKQFKTLYDAEVYLGALFKNQGIEVGE